MAGGTSNTPGWILVFVFVGIPLAICGVLGAIALWIGAGALSMN